jgi:hypothetical protein
LISKREVRSDKVEVASFSPSMGEKNGGNSKIRLMYFFDEVMKNLRHDWAFHNCDFRLKK